MRQLHAGAQRHLHEVRDLRSDQRLLMRHEIIQFLPGELGVRDGTDLPAIAVPDAPLFFAGDTVPPW